jgi:hypothetical protein
MGHLPSYAPALSGYARVFPVNQPHIRCRLTGGINAIISTTLCDSVNDRGPPSRGQQKSCPNDSAMLKDFYFAQIAFADAGNTEQPNDKHRQGPIITDQGAGTVSDRRR